MLRTHDGVLSFVLCTKHRCISTFVNTDVFPQSESRKRWWLHLGVSCHRLYTDGPRLLMVRQGGGKGQDSFSKRGLTKHCIFNLVSNKPKYRIIQNYSVKTILTLQIAWHWWNEAIDGRRSREQGLKFSFIIYELLQYAFYNAFVCSSHSSA